VTALLSEKHAEHLDAVHDADVFHLLVSLMQLLAEIIVFGDLLLLYIRSIREGNFQLYIEALSKIVPWMFALNHLHY